MKRIETPEEMIKKKKKILVKDIIFVVVIGIIIYFILYMLFFDPMGNSYKRNESLNVHYDLSKDIIPNPIQNDIPDETFSIKVKGVTMNITKMMEYDITGKVEGIQHYAYSALTMDKKSIINYISPIDLTLSYGKIALDENKGLYKADENYMNKDRTVYHYTSRELIDKYSESYFQEHITNNHLISLNNGIKKEFNKVKEGQVVRIKGYLVDVKASNGVTWGPSSTRRDDWGCEIIWVEDFLIMK